ncbi:YoaK family protein [Streptomyces sp. NPDC059176]|uniref:YoaK family protein n=1 Tax=unclassified Streptomyces TaxID=2593676 RepID=UPI00369FA14C
MPERSPSPSDPADLREHHQIGAMAVLTVLAGAIDAISFLTLGHIFTALATGNLLFLAFTLTGNGHVPAARPAIAIAAFVVGVVTGSLFTRRLFARRRGWFPAALTAEAVLLAAAGALALWRHGTRSLNDEEDYLVIAIVGLAMGLRADAVLRARVPGMPTLLMQMSLIQLMHDLSSGAGRDIPAGERRTARIRLVSTIAGIFVGGLLGALMVPWGSGRALLTVAAGVLLVACAYVLLPRCRARTAAG